MCWVKVDFKSGNQKDLLVALISSRLSVLNDNDFRAKMDKILIGLNDTYFGLQRSKHKERLAYFRIIGPTIILEYAPQVEGKDDNRLDHLHSIYRDPTDDYGADLGIIDGLKQQGSIIFQGFC